MSILNSGPVISGTHFTSDLPFPAQGTSLNVPLQVLNSRNGAALKSWEITTSIMADNHRRIGLSGGASFEARLNHQGAAHTGKPDPGGAAGHLFQHQNMIASGYAKIRVVTKYKVTKIKNF